MKWRIIILILAYPEILRKTDSEKLFQTLNMSNNEYFNAE